MIQVGPKSPAEMQMANENMWQAKRNGTVRDSLAVTLYDGLPDKVKKFLKDSKVTEYKWNALDQNGRKRVMDGPTQHEISEFLRNFKGPKSEAALALNERFGISRAQAERAVTVVLDARHTKDSLSDEIRDILSKGPMRLQELMDELDANGWDTNQTQVLYALQSAGAKKSGSAYSITKDISSAMVSFFREVDASQGGSTSNKIALIIKRFGLSEQEARDLWNEWKQEQE